jgi:transcriptional regulator with XRE-family HTH domain
MLSPAELISQAGLVAAVKCNLNNVEMASELWQRIRALRKHVGFSGEAFGAELGVSKAAVSQWEATEPAKRTSPELKTIIDMARRFEAPMAWLLDDRSDVDLEWWVDAAGTTNCAPVLEEALPVILDALQKLPRAQRAGLAADWTALLAAPDSAELRARVAGALQPLPDFPVETKDFAGKPTVAPRRPRGRHHQDDVTPAPPPSREDQG